MTLREFINFGTIARSICGVSVDTTGDTPRYSFTIVEKSASNYKIVSGGVDFTSIDELLVSLSSILPKRSRVSINIDSKGLLSKEVKKSDRMTDINSLVKDAFPMIDGRDFFSQLSKSNERVLLTIARKDFILDVVNKFSSYSVVSLSLGVIDLDQFVPMDDQVIVLNGMKLTIKSYVVQESKQTDEPSSGSFLFEGNRILISGLSSLFEAWKIDRGQLNKRMLGAGTVDAARDRFNFLHNLYRNSIRAAVAVLLALLVNTFIFFYIDARNSGLETIVADLEQFNSKTQVEGNSFARQEELFNSLGWRQNSIPIRYADQLAAGILKDIKLTACEFGAVDDRILKSERKHVYRPDIIHIKGTSATSEDLWKWVNEIKKISWVKEVTDQKYKHDVRSGLGIFEFIIKTR